MSPTFYEIQLRVQYFDPWKQIKEINSTSVSNKWTMNWIRIYSFFVLWTSSSDKRELTLK